MVFSTLSTNQMSGDVSSRNSFELLNGSLKKRRFCTLTHKSELSKPHYFTFYCRLSSANRVNVMIPFFFYSKGDQKNSRKRVPITAKLITNLLKKSGADHVMIIEPHTPQLEGFFDTPVDALKVSCLALVSIICFLKVRQSVLIASGCFCYLFFSIEKCIPFRAFLVIGEIFHTFKVDRDLIVFTPSLALLKYHFFARSSLNQLQY